MTVSAAYIRGRRPGTWHLVTDIAAAVFFCCCCDVTPPHCNWPIYGFSTLKTDLGPARGCWQCSARDAHNSARRETYCFPDCGTQPLYAWSKVGLKPLHSGSRCRVEFGVFAPCSAVSTRGTTVFVPLLVGVVDVWKDSHPGQLMR